MIERCAGTLEIATPASSHAVLRTYLSLIRSHELSVAHGHRSPFRQPLTCAPFLRYVSQAFLFITLFTSDTEPRSVGPRAGLARGQQTWNQRTRLARPADLKSMDQTG